MILSVFSTTVMSVLVAKLSALSLPRTRRWSGQYIHIRSCGFEVAMCFSHIHPMACREGSGGGRAATTSIHSISICRWASNHVLYGKTTMHSAVGACSQRFHGSWLRKSTSVCTPLQPTNQPIYPMSSSWQVEPFVLEKLACKLRRPAPSHASLAASYQEEYFLQRIQCFYSVRH